MPANRPTSAELLEAVQEFLSKEIAPQVSGSASYHLKVATNALAILEREAIQGPALDEAERAGLRGLLGRDGARDELNAALCAEIRERRKTYTDSALVSHLMKTTLGKMAIDNPKYATYVRETKS